MRSANKQNAMVMVYGLCFVYPSLVYAHLYFASLNVSVVFIRIACLNVRSFFFFFFWASPINRIVLVSCFDIVFFLLTFSFDFYNYNLKFKVSSPDAFPPLLLLHSTLFFSFFFTVNLLGIISQDHNHPSTTDNPPPKDKTRQNKGKERLFSALYTIIRTSILHVYQFLWIFLYHQMNV